MEQFPGVCGREETGLAGDRPGVAGVPTFRGSARREGLRGLFGSEGEGSGFRRERCLAGGIEAGAGSDFRSRAPEENGEQSAMAHDHAEAERIAKGALAALGLPDAA